MTSITLSVESLWIYTDRFVAQCTFQQCIDYNNYWAFNCYGMSNKGVMGKTSYFLALCVNISKMVGDTFKFIIDD